MSEEWIDCLTPDGHPLDQALPRSEVHRLGVWHRAVHVWVVDATLGLLLQKRSSLCLSNPDKWDVSCAGHVSAGESSLQAACKEMKEELGLVCDGSRLQWKASLKTSSVQNNGRYLENEWQDIYIVSNQWSLNELSLSTDVSEVKWMVVEDFAKSYQRWMAEGTLVEHQEEYRCLIEAGWLS